MNEEMENPNMLPRPSHRLGNASCHFPFCLSFMGTNPNSRPLYWRSHEPACRRGNVGAAHANFLHTVV